MKSARPLPLRVLGPLAFNLAVIAALVGAAELVARARRLAPGVPAAAVEHAASPGFVLDPALNVPAAPIVTEDWPREPARPQLPQVARWEYRWTTSESETRMSAGLVARNPDGADWFVPNAVVRAQKRPLGDDAAPALYDVVYTTSPQGFRESWPARDDPAWPAGVRDVLFLGDSLIFGEGVSDPDTLPSMLQRTGGGRYRGINLGFPGGGAHSMLEVLEAGREREVVAGARVAAAVHVVLPDHVQRVGGVYDWQLGHPRYVLRGAEVEREGEFALMPRLSRRLVGRSALLNLVHEAGRKRLLVHDDPAQNLRLWAALIAKARDMVQQRYHAPLIVLVWSGETPGAAMLVEALTEVGIRPLLLGNTLAAVDKASIPLDGHPTPRAYRAVASTLLGLLPP